MVVVPAYSRGNETYFVFREDGTETEVVFQNGKISYEKPKLTKEERQWFLDGNHLNVINQL